MDWAFVEAFLPFGRGLGDDGDAAAAAADAEDDGAGRSEFAGANGNVEFEPGEGPTIPTVPQ